MTSTRTSRTAALTAISAVAALAVIIFALAGATEAQPTTPGAEPCPLKGAAGPVLLADGESALLSYQNLTDHPISVKLMILGGSGGVLAATQGIQKLQPAFVDLPPGETVSVQADSTLLPAVQQARVSGVLEVISRHEPAQGPAPCLNCPKGLGLRMPGTGSLQLLETATGALKDVVPCDLIRGSFAPRAIPTGPSP